MHPGIPPSKWRIVLIPSAFFGLALCQAFFVGPQPIGQARITPKRSETCALCHRCGSWICESCIRNGETDLIPQLDCADPGGSSNGPL